MALDELYCRQLHAGGPVFALFKHDGDWQYRVIGIQSSWYRSDRIVSACPIASFATGLEKLVLSVRTP